MDSPGHRTEVSRPFLGSRSPGWKENMVCSSWVLWAPRSGVKLWKAASWTSPSLQSQGAHAEYGVCSHWHASLRCSALSQRSKVRSRVLRNSESCQIEDLNPVAMRHDQMDSLAQWVGMGSIMVRVNPAQR